MREQHFDLFPATASDLIFGCRGTRPRDVADIFIEMARKIPRHRIRTASRLDVADLAVIFARAVTAHAVGGDASAGRDVVGGQIFLLAALIDR